MRTSNSLKNIITTIIPFAIIGLLGFIKIRVFVNGLSNDIYSLNQLFFQIMGYLALADAGFGVILVQKMYKAFVEKDHDEISDLYSTTKIFFRRIGIFILVASIILSFFVGVFANVNVSNQYIQIVFIIFSFKNSIEYFMSAPRYVIQADQKMYKINLLVNFIKILESIVEIILVLCGVDYLYVLLPGIFIRIFINYVINKIIFKEYKWLTFNKKCNKNYLKDKYNLISQKIAGIFYSNTDIILISSFLNPIAVIVYTSYNYITKFITDIVFMLASAVTPSYANVINDSSDGKEYKLFNEMNIMFYFTASFVSAVLYALFDNFISLWVGKEYLINTIGLLLIIFILYRNISIRMMYVIINSLGLFKQTSKIILLEAALNIVLSIIGIFIFGINGVLLGTIVSTMLTTFWYFPLYIYKNVFHKKSTKYFLQYFACLLITAILIVVLHMFFQINAINFLMWVLYAIIYSVIIVIALFVIYYICFKSFRKFIARVKYFKLRK